MTVTHLRSMVRAAPFLPFNVRMADGRVFHIPHPDFISIFPSGRVAIITNLDDTFSIVDLILMTELEVSPETVSQA
jgi:hypothetical protein